ncbi:hypothetical protein JKP88DRAFT_273750 [Tribonema minus]|uniref:Uncharacterized protein n=1 Tax=Tribonema minus TaxID=303371 RepID=A0A835YWN8_9STRA|nr:hypothetical protein JKP88DRAFT_273750 [Tribonema minus]
MAQLLQERLAVAAHSRAWVDIEPPSAEDLDEALLSEMRGAVSATSTATGGGAQTAAGHVLPVPPEMVDSAQVKEVSDSSQPLNKHAKRYKHLAAERTRCAARRACGTLDQFTSHVIATALGTEAGSSGSSSAPKARPQSAAPRRTAMVTAGAAVKRPRTATALRRTQLQEKVLRLDAIIDDAQRTDVPSSLIISGGGGTAAAASAAAAHTQSHAVAAAGTQHTAAAAGTLQYCTAPSSVRSGTEGLKALIERFEAAQVEEVKAPQDGMERRRLELRAARRRARVAHTAEMRRKNDRYQRSRRQTLSQLTEGLQRRHQEQVGLTAGATSGRFGPYRLSHVLDLRRLFDLFAEPSGQVSASAMAAHPAVAADASMREALRAAAAAAPPLAGGGGGLLRPQQQRAAQMLGLRELAAAVFSYAKDEELHRMMNAIEIMRALEAAQAAIAAGEAAAAGAAAAAAPQRMSRTRARAFCNLEDEQCGTVTTMDLYDMLCACRPSLATALSAEEFQDFANRAKLDATHELDAAEVLALITAAISAEIAAANRQGGGRARISLRATRAPPLAGTTAGLKIARKASDASSDIFDWPLQSGGNAAQLANSM